MGVLLCPSGPEGGDACFQKSRVGNYFISWDNPLPADSFTMLRALKKRAR